jgi:hypothetical protein
MNEQNRRSTGGLPLLIVVMLLLASPAGNVLGADDKACSQQERTNKTLSEKLDQTAGVICPPDVDPAIKAPTPDAGKTPVIPPPGSPGGDQTVQPK